MVALPHFLPTQQSKLDRRRAREERRATKAHDRVVKANQRELKRAIQAFTNCN